MSKAIELYKQDGKPAGVYFCEECRAVYATQEQANYCHGDRLCACGEKIELNYHKTCNKCQTKEWREKEEKAEAERFEKATKIAESDYTGEMVYGHDDHYYEEVNDAIDQYLEGQEPEYVWACKNVGVPRVSTESLYENLLENMWEDADVSDLYGVDELEAAVTAFNEANKCISVWQPDYSIAILVEKERKA